ncbi:hypothetical protein KQI88_10590 [Alkaliphilus sp. MSJ-5]|uniref:Uncharacterized protein n=1 Tax=Alkaliphilus flagellatus TaxID=2841507 RepID=A0ABS6G301_9FIRM|nr:hypothetical protein [Alkaliphilus flagellatus]MBU5676865.1 hypothetical protein [Alkaliphilus flagellatus]
MTTKRTVIILSLIVLSILLVLKFVFFSNEGTHITIRNQTNEIIENLVFVSNDNEREFSISNIEPQTDISFKYDIGGFNENAVNLKHILEAGMIKNYNIIGYVYEFYSHIYIDIISINNAGELNIRVETLK